MKYIFSIYFKNFGHVLPVDQISYRRSTTGRSNFKCPKTFSIHNLDNTSLETDKLANLFGGSMIDYVA